MACGKWSQAMARHCLRFTHTVVNRGLCLHEGVGSIPILRDITWGREELVGARGRVVLLADCEPWRSCGGARGAFQAEPVMTCPCLIETISFLCFLFLSFLSFLDFSSSSSSSSSAIAVYGAILGPAPVVRQPSGLSARRVKYISKGGLVWMEKVHISR